MFLLKGKSSTFSYLRNRIYEKYYINDFFSKSQKKIVEIKKLIIEVIIFRNYEKVDDFPLILNIIF